MAKKTTIQALVRKSTKKAARPRPTGGLKAPSRPSGRPFQPRNKADWLLINLFPDDPEFPLDAELEAQIPKDLPGEVPQNLTGLYADVQVPTRSAKPPADSGRHLTDQEHYNRTFDRWADRHLTSPKYDSPLKKEEEPLLVDPATLPPYPKVVE